jgi:hypothetical protein
VNLPEHTAWNRYVQALDLSAGFGDFGDGHDAFSCCWGSGLNLMIEMGLWGEADIEYNPQTGYF